MASLPAPVGRGPARVSTDEPGGGWAASLTSRVEWRCTWWPTEPNSSMWW